MRAAAEARAARRQLDALLELMAWAYRRGREPSPDLTHLAHDLHAASLVDERRVSETGSAAAAPARLDPVDSFTTPDEAGRATGLTGRRVRQLCAAGRVAHRVVGANRYLVDLDDLHRHLRGEAA